MSSETYMSLLTGDSYLPGALTLGRALRELGTKKQLAILVSDVSAESINLLKSIYNEIIPVETIKSKSFDELIDLGRLDLISTFTKIFIWSQIQYSKVVYVDCDILPIQLIDDLFELELNADELIAASPDSGWPDIFNSGLFLTKPDIQIFNDLLNFIKTEKSPSFDGADQGLFNQFFEKNWKKLPFIYNVTPSTSYQYIPAYLKFIDKIKNIHFIGLNKPWLTKDSSDFAKGNTDKSFDILKEMHQKWWNVFNRYYSNKLEEDIFTLSNSNKITDMSSYGEAFLLDYKEFENNWKDLSISFNEKDEDAELEDEKIKEVNLPPPVFPWEISQRKKANRVSRIFSPDTDFFVEGFQ